MEALKNKQKLIYVLLHISIIFAVSCKEVKNQNRVTTKKDFIVEPNKINSILKNIKDFNITGLKYCDFAKTINFNKIKPSVFYCKIDSITDEISYKNYKINIKQPYRFGDNKTNREVSLNKKKLMVKRLLINEDELKNWYTFTNMLIDYQSSEGFYFDENYLLMINQPEGLSGRGNNISFIQFFDFKTKICYEFFLNNDLCKD
jgi:hypothetical protein